MVESSGERLHNMVTPFLNGPLSIPGTADVKRIKEHSSAVGITGEVRFDDPAKHYDASVLRQAVYDFRNWKNIRNVETVGVLRLRYDLAGQLVKKIAISLHSGSASRSRTHLQYKCYLGCYLLQEQRLQASVLAHK